MAEKAKQVVGKRKTSIARVRMTPGKGKIEINGRTMDNYFLRPTAKMMVLQPLELTETVDKYDIRVTICGGGLSGQAGAIRHGISKTLVTFNPDFRKILKEHGLLTRDSRKKERKMYGLRGSRARYQFSKR